jgi:hypothetical protein
MGLELEEIAEDAIVHIGPLAELAEDRGRPASHYLAAVALATELRVGPEAPITIKMCVGTCQRYGALDLLDHLVGRWQKASRSRGVVSINATARRRARSTGARRLLAPTTTGNPTRR